MTPDVHPAGSSPHFSNDAFHLAGSDRHGRGLCFDALARGAVSAGWGPRCVGSPVGDGVKRRVGLA